MVRNIFTAEDLESLKTDFLRLHKKAFDIINSTPSKPRIFEENGTPTESVYWKTNDGVLIMSAGEGRYDFARGFSDGVFSSDIVRNNPKI